MSVGTAVHLSVSHVSAVNSLLEAAVHADFVYIYSIVGYYG
jgi:hypothetical protein